MNEDRTRTHDSRGRAGRSARRTVTLATLLGPTAAGHAWARTTPASMTTPAVAASEATPAEEVKSPVTVRLSIDDGDQVQVIGTLGRAFAR